MLRDHPIVDIHCICSDTLYVRGFPKSESDDSVRQHLAIHTPPCEVDLSLRSKSGQIWAKYTNTDIAAKTLLLLHLKIINGSALSVKYELGVDEHGKRIVDRGSHNTVIRSIGRRKVGTGDLACQRCGAIKYASSCNCVLTGPLPGMKKRKTQDFIAPTSMGGVSYSSNSLFVGDMEYPFPSGLYLSRVIELSRKLFAEDCFDPLVELVSDTTSLGNKYPKEISESMAMADATLRAISLLPPTLRVSVSGSSLTSSTKTVPSTAGTIGASTTLQTQKISVFVLGDGCRPTTAACVCLHLPMSENFTFYSVDPLMRPELCCTTVPKDGAPLPTTAFQPPTPNLRYGKYCKRFFPLALYSQDFIIPSLHDQSPPTLSIVVSCHSHAPLQEFWDRLTGPKVAVTMACCAAYGDLAAPAVPILDFEDFEVYSPKRRVKIFVDL